MIFEANSGALVAAVLRPGKRPFGDENAMIMRRVLTMIRHHFPDTHILVRGDGHFSGPELMGLIDSMPNIDFIFGFSCNVKLLAMAEPTRLRACDLWIEGQIQDVVSGGTVSELSRTHHTNDWMDFALSCSACCWREGYVLESDLTTSAMPSPRA